MNAGTLVRVKATGEIGTVVRLPQYVIESVAPGSVPVAIASVSGLPLLFSADELEPVDD